MICFCDITTLFKQQTKMVSMLLYTLDPWWEVDLGSNTRIKEVRIFNRRWGSAGEIARLSNAIVTLKDARDQEVARYQFGSVTWAEFTLPASSFTPVRGRECSMDGDCSDGSTCINRSEDIQPECHYFPGYGNCREDPSIQCRVSSDCPLTTSETGTCNRANANASPQICQFDSDCQPNSKCEFDEPSLPTECLFNVGPFEEYAQDLVIDDATDLGRCEEVREELGYEPDHLDDIEICYTFVDLRCNPDGIFEFLEQVEEDVPTILAATPVSYSPPE